MDENVRKVEYFSDQEQSWIEIEPENVKEGMWFRMFEPDGTPVLRSDGGIFYGATEKRDSFRALSNSYMNSEGIWTVQIL